MVSIVLNPPDAQKKLVFCFSGQLCSRNETISKLGIPILSCQSFSQCGFTLFMHICVASPKSHYSQASGESKRIKYKGW